MIHANTNKEIETIVSDGGNKGGGCNSEWHDGAQSTYGNNSFIHVAGSANVSKQHGEERQGSGKATGCSTSS